MSSADRVAPGAKGSHCLVCQSIGPSQELGVLARSLTVEASRLYARLHYEAMAREASTVIPDRDGPGAGWRWDR